MSAPVVVNVRRKNLLARGVDNVQDWLALEDSLYVGRRMRIFVNKKCTFVPQSKWHNPYKGEDAVARFREYLMRNPRLLADIGELAGKELGCWCTPSPCHADVLVELWKARASN